jgi:quercetin dioxygenase-like cupin family protein
MSDENRNHAKPVILRPSEIPARERGGGARTIPLVGRGIGATSFLNGITIFEPGAAIPFHCHNCEESVMLLDGDAVAEIDGVEHPLQPGDMSFIPAGVRHRFRNLSSTKGMRILWIYGSPEANRTNLETGATGLIDEEHRVPAA